MAKGIQTSNGKAFEYACLLGLYNELSPIQKIETKDSPQLRTAQALYEGLDAKMQDALDKAANAAVRVIRRLEPQLWEPDGNEPLLQESADTETDENTILLTVDTKSFAPSPNSTVRQLIGAYNGQIKFSQTSFPYVIDESEFPNTYQYLLDNGFLA